MCIRDSPYPLSEASENPCNSTIFALDFQRIERGTIILLIRHNLSHNECQCKRNFPEIGSSQPRLHSQSCCINRLYRKTMGPTSPSGSYMPAIIDRIFLLEMLDSTGNDLMSNKNESVVLFQRMPKVRTLPLSLIHISNSSLYTSMVVVLWRLDRSWYGALGEWLMKPETVTSSIYEVESSLTIHMLWHSKRNKTMQYNYKKELSLTNCNIGDAADDVIECYNEIQIARSRIL